MVRVSRRTGGSQAPEARSAGPEGLPSPPGGTEKGLSRHPAQAEHESDRPAGPGRAERVVGCGGGAEPTTTAAPRPRTGLPGRRGRCGWPSTPGRCRWRGRRGGRRAVLPRHRRRRRGSRRRRRRRGSRRPGSSRPSWRTTIASKPRRAPAAMRHGCSSGRGRGRRRCGHRRTPPGTRRRAGSRVPSGVDRRDELPPCDRLDTEQLGGGVVGLHGWDGHREEQPDRYRQSQEPSRPAPRLRSIGPRRRSLHGCRGPGRRRNRALPGIARHGGRL